MSDPDIFPDNDPDGPFDPTPPEVDPDLPSDPDEAPSIDPEPPPVTA